MKLKNLSFIFILTGCLLFLVLINRFFDISSNESSLSSPKSEFNTSLLATENMTLSFEPQKEDILIEEEFLIKIIGETATPVRAMELWLDYDPDFLEIVDIYPGNFFPSPTEIKKEINNQKIFYVVGSFSEPGKGKGVVANILVRGKREGKTFLRFNPKTNFLPEEGEIKKVSFPALEAIFNIGL